MSEPAEYFRLECEPAGEMVLPGGGTLVSRYIARRKDGLNAYCYPVGNQVRVALFRDVGAPFTFDVTLDSTMGVECAFAGSQLYIAAATPTVATVVALTVSSDWPPVLGEAAAVEFDDPEGALRWPSIVGLKNGGVAACFYLQVTTGHKARVMYRPPDMPALPVGEDEEAKAPESWQDLGAVELPTLSFTTQTAGRCSIHQHPSGQVWLVGVKDSKCEFPAVFFDAGPTMVKAGEKVLVTGYPNNGIYDPCAMDTELPFNYRVWPEGDKLRVLGNSIHYYVAYPEGEWMKLTPLVLFDVSGDGTTSFIKLSNNWTERVTPDYAFVQDQIVLSPVAKDTPTFPTPYDRILTRDDGKVISPLGFWTPLGMGRNEIAYLRPDGKAVVNRL